MTDDTCPVCEARRENIINEHHQRVAVLLRDYDQLLIHLREELLKNVICQDEWKHEQLEIIKKLHAEHAEGDDV